MSHIKNAYIFGHNSSYQQTELQVYLEQQHTYIHQSILIKELQHYNAAVLKHGIYADITRRTPWEVPTKCGSPAVSHVMVTDNIMRAFFSKVIKRLCLLFPRDGARLAEYE